VQLLAKQIRTLYSQVLVHLACAAGLQQLQPSESTAAAMAAPGSSHLPGPYMTVPLSRGADDVDAMA
jgi:hypothetical protein